MRAAAPPGRPHFWPGTSQLQWIPSRFVCKSDGDVGQAVPDELGFAMTSLFVRHSLTYVCQHLQN
jgi:hypothetical protein